MGDQEGSPGRSAGGRGEKQQAVGGYYNALFERAHVVHMMEPRAAGLRGDRCGDGRGVVEAGNWRHRYRRRRHGCATEASSARARRRETFPVGPTGRLSTTCVVTGTLKAFSSARQRHCRWATSSARSGTDKPGATT